MSRSIPVKEIILVPAIITFVVTLVRLLGELLGGPALLFNSAAGGPGALVGITWLVPVFGAYFAWKLAQMDAISTGPWKTLGMALAAIVATILIGVLSGLVFDPTGPGPIVAFGVGGVVAILICRQGWRELYDVLLAYGLAARIPVAVVMLVAMLGDWQTHYDVAPPGFPEMNVFLKWILIGLIPQLTIWIAFTIVVGFIFAVPVMLFKGQKSGALDT